MTAAALAVFALLHTATPTPCDRPAVCGKEGVCVAGECRFGSARAAVKVLATVAVPPPQLLRGNARRGGAERPSPSLRADAPLAARARDIAWRFERALAWTGFYTVLPADRHPRVPPADRMSEPARAVWSSFGVHRVLRIAVGHGLDPGSIEIEVDLVETGRPEIIQLSAGREQIPAAGDRRAVARWVNALVGRDTGLPGCVGTRLLVSAQLAPGNKEIAVVDAHGDGISFITGNGDLNLMPAWGPPGTIGYLSYLRRNPDWMVNGVPFSTRPGLNAAGDWSPDGRTLALSVAHEDNSDIVLLDAVTGAERQRLTHHRGVDTSPIWSPDGRKLAFVSDRSGSPQIWIYDLDRGSAERLSQGGYMASPSWSPLGDSLVYTQLIAGEAILIRRDLDTGRIARLTEPGSSAESPTISPDGRYVAYVHRSPGKPAALWRIPTLGGTPEPLARHAWPLYAPDWQP